MTQTKPVTRAAWSALIMVALAQAMSLLDRNILAILAPQIKADLHIGNTEMGLISGTVFALFYALFSLPLGRLSDGWLRGRLLSISITVWSLATGLAAFASGFGMLAISRLGVGIGEAATQPAGTSLVYDYWPTERRGFVMAVLAAAIAIGLGGSNIIGGFAADWWNNSYVEGGSPFALRGWQFAFLVAAFPGFIIAIMLWRLPEPVRGAMDGIPTPTDPAPFRASAQVLGSVAPGFNWINLWRSGANGRKWLINIAALIIIASATITAEHIASGYAPRPPLELAGIKIGSHALQWSIVGFGAYVIVNLLQGLSLSDRPTYALLTRSPSLILCMIAGALQTMINYGIMLFTPSFLMKQYEMTTAETGLKFGLLAAVIGIVGPMISGPASDMISARWPGRGRIWVTIFSLGLSPLISLWVYSADSSNSFLLRFIVYSVVLTMWLPPLYAAMYELVLPRMRGIVTSVYLLLTTILGLGIGPYLVGMIADGNGGNLAGAILSINWVAPVIVCVLLILSSRIERDQALVQDRARAAGEPV